MIVKFEEITSPITAQIVQQMMQMEKEHPQAWNELWVMLSRSQIRQYKSLRREIASNARASELEKKSQDKLHAEHLLHYQIGVSRGDLGCYIEFYFDLVNDAQVKTEHLTYDAPGYVKLFQQFREIQSLDETFYYFDSKHAFAFNADVSFSAPTSLFIEKNLLEQYLGVSTTETTFQSLLQFTLYQKANLFFDLQSASSILSEADNSQLQLLNANIRCFDEAVWKHFRSEVVYQGCKQRFLQNQHLITQLEKTRGQTLAYSSEDPVWGTGLPNLASNNVPRVYWEGKNLLGQILTQVRIELLGEY